MVDLFTASCIKAVKGLTFHVASLELSSAIGVLELCVVTHFTELACIAFFTGADLASLVVRAETIALEVVGSFIRHADRVVLNYAVGSMRAGLFFFSEETSVAFFA